MVLDNDRYVLSGGVDPLQLIEEYGCPLYVYDSAIIQRQYKRMENAMKVKRLQLNYACKALSNINILKLFRKMGSGLDTVSVQEVSMGIRAGFDPQDIIFTPNCVSLEEIEEAVEYGVKINIDNTSILEQFGQAFPDTPVCIRINPHIMAGANAKTSVGHIDSKFGISFHQMPLVHRIVEATGLKVEGVHMHTGSDILDPEVFLSGAEILLNIAKEFPDLDYIDFGSGFKVAYKPGDVETDIEELGSRISERFNKFCEEYGKDLKLMFEPGKFMVSEAGYFFAQVNVIKQTTSTVFAGVDSGLNHFIRPMFYNAYHKITNISRPKGKARFYTVVGYICETDTFGINRQMTELQEGDFICMHNAGAYCFSMASNYNSRYRPAEVLVHEGQAYLIRKRENMEDLLRTQVEAPIFDEAPAVK
ncbi:diaminopimelate decarboxylase [Phaeodactylibacter sp.]|jgi:diaminopimelate decarboxylase|uniref:diaminopimelate decarboxylase n=1 Tax=Phaeodactylibacter sp. TaxID=1940289 RepID=UPI0025D7DF66|nr:diaminopimelate decarboxylase [Phaeodactylibacter sp.]MCI4651162.1 diaminopimelate decarboxylase [Phaeodactylibacter sp.]MCI5090455.1 diaminopimelate decarboxylase [Phaeodactylibacter sp.]